MAKKKITKWKNIPTFTRARYAVDVGWTDINGWIEDYNLEMNPDFQRAHVWNQVQQIAYVEYVMRHGMSGKDIFMNQPGWNEGQKGTLVVVDGKQRLTAALAFMNNEIKAFGSYKKDFDLIDRLTCSFRFHIADLETKAEVLQWYLDFNSGGTQHTEAELNKVRKLLKKDKSND